jgi:hypothetical protein
MDVGGLRGQRVRPEQCPESDVPLGADLESMLLAKAIKIFFDRIEPERMTCDRTARRYCAAPMRTASLSRAQEPTWRKHRRGEV